MVLKLYGSSQSTCTRRVAAVLHEKKVPFQFVAVDLMKGEHKAPSFLAKQPFGQVPYIVRITLLPRDIFFQSPLIMNKTG
jgi:glutathione S-transferase